MSSRPAPFLALLLAIAAPVFDLPAPAGLVEPQFQCGNVSEPNSISAADALGVLRAAVALETYSLCAADADGNRTIAASDALRVLRVAVGQIVEMRCPFCCANCGCTPQQLTITLAEVEPCEGCIPRIPVSNVDVDSVELEFDVDVNDTWELDATAECVWSATIPAAIAKKRLYPSGVSDCSGPANTFEGNDVDLLVVRSSDGWDAWVGQYAIDLFWGDVARGFVKTASCAAGGSDSNENETCHLAASGSDTDQDTHAVNGQLSIAIADPDPVCP